MIDKATSMAKYRKDICAKDKTKTLTVEEILNGINLLSDDDIEELLGKLMYENTSAAGIMLDAMLRLGFIQPLGTEEQEDDNC